MHSLRSIDLPLINFSTVTWKNEMKKSARCCLRSMVMGLGFDPLEQIPGDTCPTYECVLQLIEFQMNLS